MRKAHIAVACLSVAVLLTCASPRPPVAGGAIDTLARVAPPRYNEVWGAATHNSYWMNRTDQADYYASGAQEQLTDQLLHEHVRGLEIDIHTDGAPDGEWRVYHTSSSENFTCRLLGDCLEYLRAFHYATPLHDVVNVVIELKNTSTSICTDTGANFDGGEHFHRIEDLDALLHRHLDPYLYTPSQFLSRCAPGDRTTLRRCLDAAGWPRVDELRGRFIVNLIGNYYHAGKDWVDYSARSIAARAAFPMQSVLGLIPLASLDASYSAGPLTFPCSTAAVPVDLGAANPATGSRFACIKAISTDCKGGFPTPAPPAADRRAAFANSVFWQFEAVDDAGALGAADDFVRRRGVIRGRDSWELDGNDRSRETSCTAGDNPVRDEHQADRVAHGFQFVQTDYPWHVFRDQGPSGTSLPTDPSRRFKSFSTLSRVNPGAGVSAAALPPETGSKVYLHLGAAGGRVQAARSITGLSEAWLETTASTTRSGVSWSAVIPYDTTNGTLHAPGECPLTFPRRAGERAAGAVFAAGAEGESLRIARTKHSSCDYKGNWPMLQEGVVVTATYEGPAGSQVAAMSAGEYGPCRRTPGDTSTAACREAGSLLAIAVADGGKRVTAYSASTIDGDGRPRWTQVLSIPFRSPATLIGLEAAITPLEPEGGPDHASAACKLLDGYSARDGADVLFAGTRFSDRLDAGGRPSRLDFITRRELPIQRASPSDIDQARWSVVDLSSGLECGGEGGRCCSFDGACNARDLRCNLARCERCGHSGLACCPDAAIDGGCLDGVCVTGTCRCGLEGDPCCAASSGPACRAPGLTCRRAADGREKCLAGCGYEGGPCCANDQCNGLTCDRGVCTCGRVGQHCCVNGACGLGATCISDFCVSSSSACAQCAAQRGDPTRFCDCLSHSGCPPNLGLCGSRPR